MLRLTAKATQFGHRTFTSWLIESAGTVPINRRKDSADGNINNTEAMIKLVEALEIGDAVCLFPEGMSRHRQHFRSDVLVTFHEPLVFRVKDNPELIAPVDYNNIRLLTTKMHDIISSGTIDSPTWDLVRTAKTAARIYAPLGTFMSLGDHVRVIRNFIDALRPTEMHGSANLTISDEDDEHEVLVLNELKRLRNDLKAYQDQLTRWGIKDDRIRRPLSRHVTLSRMIIRFIWSAALFTLSFPGLLLWLPIFATTFYAVHNVKKTGPIFDTWDEIAQYKLIYGLFSGLFVCFTAVLFTWPIVPFTFVLVPAFMWMTLRWFEDTVSAFRAYTALWRLLWIGKPTLRGMHDKRQDLHSRVMNLAHTIGLPGDPESHFMETGGKEKGRVSDPWDSTRRYFSIRRRRKRDWNETLRLYDKISPLAMPGTSTAADYALFFDALRSAPTAPAAADRLAREVAKAGPQCLEDNDILKTLHTFATNKKSGYERESAAIAFTSLANILGTPIAPLLLPSLPIIFDLYMDKGEVVRNAAAAAVKVILKLFPPESTRIVFDTLVSVLEAGKWRTKVAVLDAFKTFVAPARDAVAAELGTLLIKVENAMHDTKQEVSAAAIKSATQLCTTLANPDLAPHIPVLVKCMSNPDSVPACIKALSSTTFVAEVTAPALAVLVPLLLRALNDRSMEVQRRTVVVIDNLVKLVRDPKVAATYLSPLVEGVTKIATGAAFPEVRAFANTALNTLLKSGASANGPPPNHRDIAEETATALSTLTSQLPSDLLLSGAPRFPSLAKSLNFQASMVADLVAARSFNDSEAWRRCVGVYLTIWMEGDTATAFAETIRLHYHAMDKAKYAVSPASSDEGEVLCDTLFSLAYGALLLLSHTTLRLIRGRRYGILGTNGSGKSTLMRQLKEGKVENFPPQSQLRCVMVEHSLQGEDGSLSVLDFIAADPALVHVPRSQIRDQLLEVGFDDERQAEIVGGLSGGWKMKLELARAMLYKADLLLLDEPTNHLDKASVKWLEQYLISQKNITCLIVSHDSGRVGVVGPNGAGKSTLIKLITGETIPQEGTVYKHPALRVGYVSQHATHHIERHLEKTPIGYIQWRFQDGHDRELFEKATRVLTPEEQRIFDTEWVGKDGSKRKLELELRKQQMLLGRQKLKKSFQYEIKWRGLDHKFNTWVSREDLLAKGFAKPVQQFDDLEASREGAGARDTAAHLVRKHLEQIGLDGDIAQYNEISGLSGGKYYLLRHRAFYTDESSRPKDQTDREALGGLAVAIKDWAGAVVIISHNEEFVSALCPEIWNVNAGCMTHQGKAALVEDAFLDGKSPKGSGTNTPARSRLQTPSTSTAGTPIASGDEATPVVSPVVKKKKMTRNQLKAQEERRRLRKLRWLSEGGPKPEDTDDEMDP
ncbi:hypothetical protein C0989_004390 [Termitomyces sp. Mn162]|nr:hypothetical protein C0989_004390 [Termitomyces sp. Mn162]